MINLKLMEAPIASVSFLSGFYSFPCCGILLSATLVAFPSSFPCPLLSYVYVMIEGLSNITTQNMLPTMWSQKTK